MWWPVFTTFRVKNKIVAAILDGLYRWRMTRTTMDQMDSRTALQSGWWSPGKWVCVGTSVRLQDWCGGRATCSVEETKRCQAYPTLRATSQFGLALLGSALLGKRFLCGRLDWGSWCTSLQQQTPLCIQSGGIGLIKGVKFYWVGSVWIGGMKWKKFETNINHVSLSDYQAYYDSPNFKVLLKYTLKQNFFQNLSLKLLKLFKEK